ncbi:MAG: acyl-CoA dehydrogenase family protein, partial [Acidimicrobiia bacterium]
MTTTMPTLDLLTDDLLARLDARAMTYDRENRFFTEDFEDLVSAGFLALPLPEDRGGRGATIAEVVAANRRLASVAPATAVACNMHLYWVGIAADLERAGDSRGKFILDAAAAGRVLAA